jgi:hypothetical protein
MRSRGVLCGSIVAVSAQRFEVVARSGGRGRVFVPIPFDPNKIWRPKPQHHVRGTVNGMRVRGVVASQGEDRGLLLGPVWLRGCGVAPGDVLAVVIEPEGPQRDDLAEDIVAALEVNPRAAAFFDSLAQFYRRAYLRWIDATKRRPDLRAERIAEMIELLTAGMKERPKQ